MLNAVDEMEVLEALSQKGLTPVDISTGQHVGPWWQREVRLSAGRSAPPRDLQPVCATLATLLKARIPLTEALGFVEGQTSSHKLKTALMAMRSDVENGLTLSQALLDHDAVIPRRVSQIMSMGEASDTLPEALERAADMLSSEVKIQNELRSALVYPIVLVLMSLLVLALIVFYLVPTLVPVFQTAGASPPPLLGFMESIRALIVGASVEILVILAALGGLFFAFRKQILRSLSQLLIWLPFTGSYLRKRETLRLCQNLAVMIGAGASALEALETSQRMAATSVWRAEIGEARVAIEAGQSLSQSIETVSFLDPMVRALIKAGDKSDTLLEMLQAAIVELEGQTSATLKRALALLTPALTLIIGGVVGTLIISTITAILDLNEIAF